MKTLRGDGEQLRKEARELLYSFLITGDERTLQEVESIDQRLARRGALELVESGEESARQGRAGGL